MSGHSKWSTIKRAKAITDAKKGAIFTKLSKLVTIAAKSGGDLSSNFTLRMAVDKARAANMPKDNIERAIKKGTGELDGGQLYELTYEGIGPNNSQFILQCLTDNKNRTAANIRQIFVKAGGSLGAVMWNFEQKGVILIKNEAIKDLDWDEFELGLIDAGIDDVLKESEGVTIYTPAKSLQIIKQFLEDKKVVTESAEIEYVAKEKKKIEEGGKEKMERFIDSIDEDEDISDYYTNIEM